VLEIRPLIFLFIIQFLLLFAALSIFLIFRCRALSVKEALARKETVELRAEISGSSQQIEVKSAEFDQLKNTFDDLQQKFIHIKESNAKLKTLIEALVPEANRSKEFAKVIGEIEESNKELDSCINTLQKENTDLEKKAKSLEREAEGLADLLQQSVRKEELYQAQSQKKALEIKMTKVERDLQEKTDAYDQLQKNYTWLEKEFNALYKNVSQETA
jgi:chromosome segregation ATPase